MANGDDSCVVVRDFVFRYVVRNRFYRHSKDERVVRPRQEQSSLSGGILVKDKTPAQSARAVLISACGCVSGKRHGRKDESQSRDAIDDAGGEPRSVSD